MKQTYHLRDRWGGSDAVVVSEQNITPDIALEIWGAYRNYERQKLSEYEKARERALRVGAWPMNPRLEEGESRESHQKRVKEAYTKRVEWEKGAGAALLAVPAIDWIVANYSWIERADLILVETRHRDQSHKQKTEAAKIVPPDDDDVAAFREELRDEELDR